MSEPGGEPKAFVFSPYENFTERARKALTLAQEEARTLLHPSIGTEHLLLGLMRVEDCVGAKALVNMGVNMDQLRKALHGIMAHAEHERTQEVGPHKEIHEMGAGMGLTPRAKKAMELAVREAKRLRHHYIGTEHLLLGLICEGEGIAAKALALFGVTLVAARAQVVLLLNGIGRDASPGGPKSNVITCRVEDRDLDAIDALIEAGIRTTRSDAAAWLISAGIQANRALFERVDATVAEIRRLRLAAQEMAQQVIAGQAPAAQEPPASAEGGPE